MLGSVKLAKLCVEALKMVFHNWTAYWETARLEKKRRPGKTRKIRDKYTNLANFESEFPNAMNQGSMWSHWGIELTCYKQ